VEDVEEEEDNPSDKFQVVTPKPDRMPRTDPWTENV
jgi:hypothetical protein